MITEEMRAAAAVRAQQTRAPADRPSKRRCAEEPGSLPVVRVAVRGLDVRAAGAGGGSHKFRGYASVTATGYEMYDWAGPYTELVDVGAFAVTLSRSDLDVPLVLQHESLRRIARTTSGSLSLTEDDTGLLVEADLDPDDHDVQYIVPKLTRGDIDEMSFKFRITSGQWSPDWTEYHIKEVDLHRGDVAIVGYGASPHTAGAGLRAPAPDPLTLVRGLPDDQARVAFEALRARLAPDPTPSAVRITDEDVQLRVL
ncbi:HK97 family phage prohead protease [Saccharothrix lopnurensis]|uniref:HK97 family phage prohead protease n=1 Tax=Saccharothrix lopnurensis TaxID=1670621 RepID=A0ABW1P1J9_9PSEU